MSDESDAGALPSVLGAFQDRFLHEHASHAYTGEGLRERKKRLMRQLISDTATGLFLERGFDEVTVAEVAAACEVSEKTIYNYFPTKESLILDQEDAMADAIVRVLGPNGPAGSPVEAMVALLSVEIRRFYDDFEHDHGRPLDEGLVLIRQFADLIESTPSLRAAQLELSERLVELAARQMAERAGVDPNDPEPQIAAAALMALWRVQFRAMHRYSEGVYPPGAVRDLVLAEVHRAARLIDTGLWSFAMAVQGASGREQLRVAAEAANVARKQVQAALKQAHLAWHQMAAEAHAQGERRRPPRPRPPRGRGTGRR